MIVLHGGPGLDHSSFRPYLDPLGDEFRLLYVDERGQGRSERVDPATLSLDVFARDVDLLADALELERFALLGHSFGAIITTKHAIEIGTADAYVISGGGDSSAALAADVDASLEAMGEAGAPIKASWEQEKTVATEDELKELLRVQMPFHFAGDPPPGYGEETIGTPGRAPAFREHRLRRLRLRARPPPRLEADPRRCRRARPHDRRRGPPAFSTRGLPAAASSSCPESVT